MSDPKDPLARFAERLSLPLIAAPMFLVSGVDLVVAASGHGVIGWFPTANCRNADELDSWLIEMDARLRRRADETGVACAPICPNLIVHRSNVRLRDDLRIVLKHAPELVITSVGSPGPVLAPLHDAGALVFADVASIRHAERAVEAGADGLVLLTAGAGGQTGWLNPFAFTRAVRRFFSGPKTCDDDHRSLGQGRLCTRATSQVVPKGRRFNFSGQKRPTGIASQCLYGQTTGAVPP